MKIEKEELINSAGGWAPGKLEYKPIFIWPLRPLAFFKWLFHYPDGFIFPWAIIHFAITLLSYLLFLPTFDKFASLSFDWVGIIFIRNFIILFTYSGLWHLHLHINKSQEDKYRYNLKPLGVGKRWFLGSQTRENMFWSLCSAVPIWTIYESFMLWSYANDYMLFPIKDWFSNPLYFTILLIFIPIIQHIHFYFIHRLIHWKPLYKWIHYLHHRNVNVGPWSGLSMHPVEHLLYLSTILIHFIIPSHPLHFIYQGMHTTLGAQKGHSGYERLVVNSRTGKSLPGAGYFHYLHHKYFECNYGELTSPLDKWFGSFHNGTKKSHEKLFKRKLK
jgi:sterol desaturase/sphingolipid hydroxylase (fatty acid hydroxylase superfamily)|tara:strand:- start:1887 stop:2879 length:993 start_codon:yes stop_codon:yes gene_type:complete